MSQTWINRGSLISASHSSSFFQTGILIIFQYLGHLHTAIYSDEPAIQGHCVEDEQIQDLKSEDEQQLKQKRTIEL